MVKVAIAVLNSYQDLNIITINFKMKGYKKKFIMYDAHIKKYLMKIYDVPEEIFDELYEFEWGIMNGKIDNIDYDDFIKECEGDYWQELKNKLIERNKDYNVELIWDDEN
jgi:hypothetical protein